MPKKILLMICGSFLAEPVSDASSLCNIARTCPKLRCIAQEVLYRDIKDPKRVIVLARTLHRIPRLATLVRSFDMSKSSKAVSLLLRELPDYVLLSLTLSNFLEA